MKNGGRSNATIMIYPISLTVREKEIAGNSNAMSSIFA
jgi:hypothetical protein